MRPLRVYRYDFRFDKQMRILHISIKICTTKKFFLQKEFNHKRERDYTVRCAYPINNGYGT